MRGRVKLGRAHQKMGGGVLLYVHLYRLHISTKIKRRVNLKIKLLFSPVHDHQEMA